MLVNILYMLYTLAYSVLPFLYKSKRPAMLQFYLRMTWSRSFRKCYSLGMLATLMVFAGNARHAHGVPLLPSECIRECL